MSALPVLTVKLTDGQMKLVNEYLALRLADDPKHFERTPKNILLGTPFMRGILQEIEDLKQRMAA